MFSLQNGRNAREPSSDAGQQSPHARTFVLRGGFFRPSEALRTRHSKSTCRRLFLIASRWCPWDDLYSDGLGLSQCKMQHPRRNRIEYSFGVQGTAAHPVFLQSDVYTAFLGSPAPRREGACPQNMLVELLRARGSARSGSRSGERSLLPPPHRSRQAASSCSRSSPPRPT